jgi:hypothetical protein
MKILIFYLDRFRYTTADKGLDTAVEQNIAREHADCIAAFTQIEESDVDDRQKKETKYVKFLKWAAGKNNTKKIILHSFNHLSGSNAPADFSKDIFDSAEKRLTYSGYETEQTPFGYFLDLELQAPGHSLARLFKEI